MSAMSSKTASKLGPTGTGNPLTFTLVLTGIFVALGFAAGARTNTNLAWAFGAMTAILLCWQAWLFLLQRRNEIKIVCEFVPVRSHYVQALVQLSVYLYWGWFYRSVYIEAPLILSQVAFLYIFDALLTWSRRMTWRLG